MSPPIIVFAASFVWPFIIIIGLILLSDTKNFTEKHTPYLIAGIALTAIGAFASTYLGLVFYVSVGVVTALAAFIIYLLNVDASEYDPDTNN